MTDRELLEAAAKAAGIEIVRSRMNDPLFRDMLLPAVNGLGVGWNPLTDDGDALRLAVKLNLFTGPDFYHFRSLERFAHQDRDEYFVTRLAITRAAAASAPGAARKDGAA